MLRKHSLVIVLILLSAVIMSGQQEKPQPANDILQSAYKEAKSTDKNVFLFFHASWCGWCKRLEKAMQSSELKKIFEGNYIIKHIDVLEGKEKIEELENPGGREIMAKLGGEKSGLPFYVFLDSAGEKLADSNVMPKNQNIGYPGSDDEIEAFGKILKSSAKHMNDEQLTAVIDYLKKNAPKPASN